MRPFSFTALYSFPPLVHFALHKKKARRLRHAADILRKLRRGAFEKSGVPPSQSVVAGRRTEASRKIDDLSDIRSLPLVIRIVHRIPFGEHRLGKPVLILLFEIALLTVQKIYLFKLSCFEIFILNFSYRYSSIEHVFP